MIQLSNSAPITLAPGEVASFDRTLINTGNCTCFRSVSPSVKMTSRGIYDIRFSGNITGATAATPVQVSFMIGGIVAPQSTMIATPATSGALNNVSQQYYYPNCCDDFSRVSVINSGTEAATIAANAVFAVKKVR